MRMTLTRRKPANPFQPSGGATHLSECRSGQHVTLVGVVTSITIPPSNTPSEPVILTVDDGTASFTLAINREDERPATGAMLRVDGTVKSTGGKTWVENHSMTILTNPGDIHPRAQLIGR